VVSKKLPTIKAKDMEKVLFKMDFYFVRQQGSHKIYKHSDGRWTTLSFHSGEDIGRGLLRKILKDLETTREEFLKLL
jgi:predicted RNA binding protein YcfA (HicA-like mRNA interferase family)